MTHFWIRDEARDTERRAPIVPADAAMLINRGMIVTVESSEKRVFTDQEYAEAGCDIAPSGSWVKAPEDVVILGVKELPAEPETLSHRFVHFAHLYKEQSGWRKELARFAEGGGTLYDIEYLTDGPRRVAAFGYWAGWLGARVGLHRLAARRAGEALPGAVDVFPDQDTALAPVRALVEKAGPIRALVVGALGKSGTGAVSFLKAAGVDVTQWDKAETDPLDREALLGHDMLVNCALTTGPGLILATGDHLKAPGTRLSMIADVSCDPLSDFNPLPVYDAPTSWAAPYLDLGPNGAGEPVELTAIDNLPSLLPRDASIDFSAQLAPVLARFPSGGEWAAALDCYLDALRRMEQGLTTPPA